jgi:hypothetical protein
LRQPATPELHACCWSPDGRMLAVTSGLGVYLFGFRHS